MGIITTQNQEVLGLKGLHLYHGDISNYSMRVRMALEEKQAPWVSHHLDLKKNETRTPAYFSVNPYGLVPALVDDGVLLIESDDILEYIEDKFPDPPLRPADQAGRDEVHRWLKLATGIHIKAGKLQILATSGVNRSRFLPDVPTFKEQGFDVQGRGWFGVLLPPQSAPDVVMRINKAVTDALATTDLIDFMHKGGLDCAPTSPAGFAEIIKSDIDFWGTAVLTSGVALEN